MAKCIVPDCQREAADGMRGACRACYAVIRKAIKRGKLTDEQAVASNLLLPAKSSGGGTTSVAAKAIAAALRQANSHTNRDG